MLSSAQTPGRALHDSTPEQGVLPRDGGLPEVVQRLSLARSLPAVQEIVRTAARRLTGADGATFVLRDGECCYYADEDAISPLWRGQRFPLRTCISGWTMLNRRPALIADIYQDDRIPHDAYRPTFVKSLAMIPIRQLDPIGAIGNYWARRHEPTAREISLLQALADSTAVAMENVRVHEELETAHSETLRRVTLASENERRRWARELHDETLQAMAGLRMRLALARRRADLESWERAGGEAIAELEREIANLRAIVTDLRPPVLDELGLRTAIEELAGHHERTHELKVQCSVGGLAAGLGQEIETTVYRLVQECLTNVVKHARAEHVTVTVLIDGECVEVLVADDGVGFDSDRRTSGFGLTGLRERAALVGGSVAIESSEAGTTVRVTIPIHGLQDAPEG